MKDKMTNESKKANGSYKEVIINPFDAMMMVVVRRLDAAYIELKNTKPPVKKLKLL